MEPSSPGAAGCYAPRPAPVPTPHPPPRLYAIVATAAPVALVFQRGPSGWWSLHRWDLSTGQLQPGAAFHGTLYPRRCDLSPRGDLLAYFALKGSSREFLGVTGLHTYSAVSKVPWLFALVAYREIGTYSRGLCFVDAALASAPLAGPPTVGDLAPLRARHRLSLALTSPAVYATELRRGWVEADGSAPRAPDDVWDERRRVTLTKRRPATKRAHDDRLVLLDQGIGRQGIEGRAPLFRLDSAKRAFPLTDVAWADWDPFGRLLVATHDGRLQIRDPDSASLEVRVEHVLVRALAPRPAPDDARRW